MSRIIAIVVAIAMIAGAIVLRSRLDERGEEQAQTLRVVCVTELEAVCTALEDLDDATVEAAVEPAAVTADRLATITTTDIGMDAWLAPAPWPTIVAEARQRAGLDPLLAAPSATLARSPLVMVIWRDRAEVLQKRCQGPVGWKCAGEAAGEPSWASIGGSEQWGAVKPLHADPRREAAGLAVLGAASASYFGRSDISAANLDDDGYLTWATGFARALPPFLPAPTANVQEMLTKGAAAVDFVGTTEAEAEPALRLSTRRGDIVLIYPSPVATVDVVVTGAANERGRRAADLVRDRASKALGAAGWRVDGQAPQSGAAAPPPLPGTSGLPVPGVLDALRSRFAELVR